MKNSKSITKVFVFCIYLFSTIVSQTLTIREAASADEPAKPTVSQKTWSDVVREQQTNEGKKPTGVTTRTNTADAHVSPSELPNQITELRARVDKMASSLKGKIIMWSGSMHQTGHPIIDGEPDQNWQICNGTNGAPDLRGRFIVGAGTNNLGQYGGSDQIIVRTANMPSHNHTGFGQTTDAAHSHQYKHNPITGAPHLGNPATIGVPTPVLTVTKDTDTNSHGHAYSFTTTSSGNGSPIEHMPPFYSLTFLIYVGE